ncbi:DUF5707 domain-containing protein [Streptomyces sp. NPDC088387]|uniref:DUF5707 domain-containing protein n=1 Tax=Streptomyces sp. NPDC088387 TaxID=3365859 RepID=UPI0038046A60
MSRRIALSAAAAVVVLGGAGAFALAYAGDEQAPALDGSTARYTAPQGDRDGSFTFTTDVTASSGVKSVKVLAWPADSSLAEQEPTAKEMADVEAATCESTGDDTTKCTYRTPVPAAEATPKGDWYVATLTTAKDGTTTLNTKTTTFTVK